MRLIERLGRFTSKQEKEALFLRFKGFYDRLHECKILIEKQAQLYPQVLARTSSTGGGAVTSRTANFEIELPFLVKMKNYIRQLQVSWVEIFQQGSLKRLQQVLTLLRIPHHDIVIQPALGDWGSRVLQYYEVSRVKKRKGRCFGCCLS